MMASGSLLVVAAAALLASCGAVSNQEQGMSGHGDHFDTNDHKSGTLELAGGGRARPAREVHPLFLIYNPYSGDLLPGFDSDRGKRNFDEIDRSGLDSFANRKRSFDEIDNSMMPFPHAKRFLRYYRPNFLGAPDFDRKRNRQGDFPMDEIDISEFPIGSKRSEPFPHNLAFR